MQPVVKQFLLPVHNCVRRITSRGWRSNVLLLLSIIFASSFLYLMIADAALQFRPEAQDAKDLDIAYIARQTTVLKDLLEIFEGIPTTQALQNDRQSLRHTIEIMQGALYPWITQAKKGHHSYSSFFDLIDSYTEEAGIVISTGKNGFRWAVHQIVSLRAVLNCSLPIEVFYGGDRDLPNKYRQFIKSLGSSFPDSGSITMVDITEKFLDPEGVLDLPAGWAMKPYALLASSFKTAILVDADTIFLQDPRVLLKEPSYEQYGSIFWHDRLNIDSGTEETYKWTEELLESVKAKNMDQVRDAGWFRREVFHEMERSSLK